MKKRSILLAVVIIIGFLSSCKKENIVLPDKDSSVFENTETSFAQGEEPPTELFSPNGIVEATREMKVLLPGQTEPTTITVDIIDGYAIAEGDIIIGKMDENLEANSRGVVTTELGAKWPNAIIPYVIEGGHPSTDIIKDAIQHMNDKTNLTLVKRTNQMDYVKFIMSDGCSSEVGRKGGLQTIRIGTSCQFGTIVHEIGHAAGVWHEHSRCDRDTFVTVHYENITEEKKGNFNRYCQGADDIGEYDYNSIMHYGTKNWSKNGKPTMTVNTPPGNSSTVIGQRTALSSGDIATINHLYNSHTPFGGKFTGVFRKNANKTKIWIGANWKHFNEKRAEFAGIGYKLMDVETYLHNGKRLYDGVWEKTTKGSAFYQFSSWTAFTKKHKDLVGDGYRLIDIETFKSTSGKRYYIGVFRKGTGKYGLYKHKNWSAFTSKWNDLSKDGFRLLDVETYQSNGQTYYLSVYRGGTGAYALFQTSSWTKFKEIKSNQTAKNRRMIDFERFKVGNSFRYLGVWRGGNDAHAFWHNTTWDSFYQKKKEWEAQGIHLVDYDRL